MFEVPQLSEAEKAQINKEVRSSNDSRAELIEISRGLYELKSKLKLDDDQLATRLRISRDELSILFKANSPFDNDLKNLLLKVRPKIISLTPRY